MRVIEPAQFHRPITKKHRLRRWLILFLAGALLFSWVLYIAPLAVVRGNVNNVSPVGLTPPNLRWPTSGQAAFGAAGYGVLAQAGAQTTAPIASVAKVMTAMAVLRAKPLKRGETGPLITLTAADTALYRHFVMLNGSVVPVNEGEQITEYQAMQAMLLPSANNMAATLARWAFGSEAVYVTNANELAKRLHLSQTHIADSSGYSPQTTSTPHDLVLLGIAALQDSVLAEISQQKTATIPVAGRIENTNELLGQNGVNGIKTGNTDQAGGCLLFSSIQVYPNGQRVTLVGAIMGVTNLKTVFPEAVTLLRSAIPGFQLVTIIRKGTVVGIYHTEWGESARAIVHDDVRALLWAADSPAIKIKLADLRGATKQNAKVGTVTVSAAGLQRDLPISLETSISLPGVTWRLNHLLNQK